MLDYLRTLTPPRYSAHWTAMNRCVLRTVFDKICGCRFLCDRHGPRMPETLPEILSEDQVVRMLEATGTLRDRMIIGLLYGCGLKVGELRSLRWMDLDAAGETVTVHSRFGSRVLPLPKVLAPMLSEGVRRCSPEAYLLAGADGRRCLSARRIQVLVHRVAEDAGIDKPVTAMTLRHTYAVQSLEAGSNVREVQQSLGHRFVQSTMRYLVYLLPTNAISPVDSDGSSPPLVRILCPATAPLIHTAGTLGTDPLLSRTRSAREFFTTLRMQLGGRLFAPRRANRATGPP